MSTVAPARPGRIGQRGDSAPAARPHWPLERILFLMAGTMTGLSALLAALVSPWFLLLTGFIAANQLAYVAFGNCPTSLLLRRLGAQAGCER